MRTKLNWFGLSVTIAFLSALSAGTLHAAESPESSNQQCPWLSPRSMENCGVLVLQAALQRFGVDAQQDDLLRRSGTFHGLTSIAGLTKAAREKGLQAEGLQLSPNELQKLSETYSLILLLEPSRHFILVEAVNASNIGFYDPTARHIHDSLSWQLIGARWKGKAIVLGKKSIPETYSRLSAQVQSATLGGAGCQNCPGPGGPEPDPPEECDENRSCSTTDEPVMLNNGNLFEVVRDVHIPSRGEVAMEFTRRYNAQAMSILADWDAEPGSGPWAIEQGQYAGSGDRSISKQSWGDFTAEIDLQTVDPGQEIFDVAWVNFRWTDENNRYYCLINKNGELELSKRKAGVATFIAKTANTAFNPLSWNRIKIVTQGAKLQLYVNNSLQIDYTDPAPLLSGQFALESHFSHSHFDNFKAVSPTGTVTQNFNQIDNDFLVGNNWTSTYDWRILLPPCGCIYVLHPDGRTDKYTQSGTTLTPPPLVFDALTQTPTGWKLTTKQGTVYTFNTAGELLSIADRNGNTTTLTYAAVSATAPANLEPVPYLLVDNFENGTANLNALGRWTDDDGTLALDQDVTGTHRMTWNASGDYWYSTLGDAAFRLDARAYQSLTFKIRGAVGGERFHIELQDATKTVSVNSATYVTLTAATKTVTIPLTAWTNQGLDPSGIKAISLKFDLSAAGSVFIDDISFINPAPTNPAIHYTVRRPTVITNPSSRKLTLAYGANGKLASITDPITRITRFTYDTQRNLVTSTDPKGGIRRYTYNPNRTLASHTDPRGNTTTATYYYNNRCASQTDALGNVTAFDYQWDLTNVINARGETSRYHFDFNTARVLSKTNALNQMTIWGYDANRVVSAYTDEKGSITRLSHDSKANRLTRTDPVNALTRWTYEPVFNKPTSRTDALGRVTSYQYDAKGNLIRITDPNGGVTISTYDAFGNVLTVTDPVGAVTTFTYDAHGNVLTAKDALGNITTFTYDAAGRRTSVKNARGFITRQAYDANDALVSVTNAISQVTSFIHDASGNLTQITRPGSNITKFAYDKLNNRISSTDPLNKTTTFSYDTADFMHKGISALVSIADPLGRITSYTYDLDNHVITVTDALSRIVHLSYDAAGNATQITDPNGNITRYVYDGNNQVRTVTYADGKTFNFDYDALGNIRSTTDQRGVLVLFTYDKLNRLTKKTYPDNTSVSFTYDASGKLLTASNAMGTSSRAYDLLGRLTTVLSPGNFALGMTYDVVGNRKTLTYPGTPTITYTYDALDRLTSQTDLNAQTVSFAYDVLSRRTKRTLPNTTSTTYGFDAASHVTAINNLKGTASLASAVYTYDALGNRLSQTLQPGNIVTAYTYDSTYQLTQSSNPALTYAYDKVGNRTASSGSSYSANNMNRYTSVNNAAYTYDAAGNLTNDGVAAYTWDYDGQLVKVVKGSTTITFGYDPFGRRASKTVNGAVSRYIYDEFNLIEEIDAANAIQARYLYGPSTDEPLEMKRGTTTNYYAADVQGSIVHVTNSAGAIVEKYSYDPYGLPVIKDSTGIVLTASAMKNPFLYTGREWEPEMGSYYNRARYYKPSLGRFLSQDPMGQSAGINMYAYVFNSPLGATDPLGLCAFNTIDFVWHYRFGGGTPIDLGAVGLLDEFQVSPSVQEAVTVFKDMIHVAAGRNARALCNGCSEGVKATTFSLNNPTVTDVTGQPCLFSVGNSTFFRTAECSAVADCGSRVFSYECSASFSIRDWFEKPLNIDLELGTPYPINASWSDTVTGSGNF